jgi:hypothetical protein
MQDLATKVIARELINRIPKHFRCQPAQTANFPNTSKHPRVHPGRKEPNRIQKDEQNELIVLIIIFLN